MPKRLADAAFIIMGQSPEGDYVSQSPIGLPLLNGPTEFGQHHPQPKQYARVARKAAEAGDILFCVRGSTTGRMNWADQRYAIGRGIAAIRHKSDPVLQPLVRAVIEMALPGLLAQSTGSTFPNVSAAQIGDIAFPELSNEELRVCAAVFGALDDKIELNRKMSATLEAMARALFKSWFVDFDPVRAKAEGRDPGLPPDIAALFPESFEDSELGLIPNGWQIRTTGDVIRRLPVGRRYEQKTVTAAGSIPVLDQGKTGIIGYHSDKPGVTATPSAPVVVFANHTCYMRLVDFPFSTIQNVLPFVGKNIETTWVYYATLGKQTFTEYKGHWPDFVRHMLVVPSPAPSALFVEIARPLIARISLATRESRTLASLRDLLLPKLISGEIRVTDAGRLVEQTA